MSLVLLASGVLAILVASYFAYGRLVARPFGLNDRNPTPACLINDGVDYVPAKARFLFGQHFSAITAAGPIVGPILAGLWFGWGPALVWILVGAVFIGAVHDFSSLIGSVRHRAQSVAEIVRAYMGERAFLAFIAFIWLSLVYVIVAFTDLTSGSFVEPEHGAGVASSSTIYLCIALVMGFCLHRLRMPLWLATLIFVPLVGVVIWLGDSLPLVIPAIGGLEPRAIWNLIILTYCFVASVLPVWLLLQPRGYLGGFFLYGFLVFSLLGILFGGFSARYPIFVSWVSPAGLPLFPLLFVTIACGACSGFHGIVSSGTTSKQIERESDCRRIGYGAMLLEGLVAVISLSTVMLLGSGDPGVKAQPDRIFANGVALFISVFGVNVEVARSFALLAFTTFIYDTLDVATRLGRYLLQELLGWRGALGRYGATLGTLAIPLAYVLLVPSTVQLGGGKPVPTWALVWSLFGTSNQLLAALTLLAVTVWIARERGRVFMMTLLPTAFMLCMTLWSLALWIGPFFDKALHGELRVDSSLINGLGATVLFALAALLVLKSASIVLRRLLAKPETATAP
ncbi:MAG TPA: carbon starvation CstA family protein [Candidatus Acidoferrales bacterium]|nr:carbon starvation CstA family protein [Candidatus Acidoferrales bacterium]